MATPLPRPGAELDGKQPVERKVTAATTASTLTAAAVAVLGLYVFHGDVPDWVTAVVGTLVTGALTFLAGYRAKRTPRLPAGALAVPQPLKFADRRPGRGGYEAPATPFEMPEMTAGPAQGAPPASTPAERDEPPLT
ncbi:hypothetical protein [Amycolatopsis sp. cmx-4-68]|uniref:hypothetical protein n=1 Tax=Amycolatopsis sp. cmx-4-68 TaxID=2790938 RepID=UPI00397DAF77